MAEPTRWPDYTVYIEKETYITTKYIISSGTQNILCNIRKIQDKIKKNRKLIDLENTTIEIEDST